MMKMMILEAGEDEDNEDNEIMMKMMIPATNWRLSATLTPGKFRWLHDHQNDDLMMNNHQLPLLPSSSPLSLSSPP